MRVVRLLLVPAVTALVAMPAARSETSSCGQTASAAVVVLVTPPRGSVTELRELEPGSSTLGRSLGKVRHAPDTLVKVAAVPGSRTIAISAVPARRRDLSFAASLYLMRPGAAPNMSVDRLQHGVPPVATKGQLFVTRGQPGAEPSDGETTRSDSLTLDAVNLATGAASTLVKSSGQLLMPLGVAGTEVILYRLGESGADIVGVDIGSRAVRPLAQVSPLARDFAVDEAGRAILFTALAGKSRWEVERLQLAGGPPEAVVTGGTPALSPHPWPGGLVYSRPGVGLTFVNAKGGETRWAPLGPGVDQVRAVACHAGVRWAIGLHKGSGPQASLFSFDPLHKRVVVMGKVKGTIEIGGVVDGSSP